MEQRARASDKDGFSTSKILIYGFQNLNFPLEMGSFLIIYHFSSETLLVATVPSNCASKVK